MSVRRRLRELFGLTEGSWEPPIALQPLPERDIEPMVWHYEPLFTEPLGNIFNRKPTVRERLMDRRRANRRC